jgi:CheY-like chemotaxis protein
VTTADGGEKGIERAQREPFDLILLDVMMPVVDGKEVCARLKASPSTASDPDHHSSRRWTTPRRARNAWR